MSGRALAALALATALVAAWGGTAERSTSSATTAAAAAAPSPRALTPEQLAGQHVILSFRGRTPPRALLARIRRGEAAGVVFFAENLGTPAQVRALVRTLQRTPRPRGLRAPLLMMVDQEGGSVMRLPGAPTRGAPAMAATGRPAVAEQEGRRTAATLRAAGMNVDLAPVADVVRPEGALHAEGRGFGFTAASAGRFAAAFTRGLVAGGVAATAKHFPGFGAALVNTDDGEVRIRVGADELRHVDRRPFVDAIEAGAGLVMVSSAVYPALDDAPAVLSRAVVEGELRDGLGFAGVTVSDDLDAPSLTRHAVEGTVAVQAANAGIDLLLFARGYGGGARGAQALAQAIRAGAVDRGALERGAARIMALRASLARVPSQ